YFKLEGAQSYRAYLFGFPTSLLQGRGRLAWITFHALDFTAIMVIAGCAIAIRRRLRDRGAIALQSFLLGCVLLLLVIPIAVTALMLTATSLWLEGYMSFFIALTHHTLVLHNLLYSPIGKLFPVVRHPASMGKKLCQLKKRGRPQA